MNNEAIILIVDDEDDFRKGLLRIVQTGLKQVRCLDAPSGEQALEIIRNQAVAVMLTDMRMPNMSGIELLEKAQVIAPELTTVVITAYGTIEDAVRAVKKGAYDFVTKPIDKTALIHVLTKALERHELLSENRILQAKVEALGTDKKMIGESRPMEQLFKQISAVARTDYTVLIRGASGTGKELAARMIHRLSSRATRPFLSINCPAIPEPLLESELFGYVRGAFTGADKNHTGLFEAAAGGTLLLDEIGDISHNIQAKLLRVLQEKEIRPVGSNQKRKIDVRILATTNQDLENKITAGSFREDLFYRLNVLGITVPRLEEHKTDIALLVHHYLQKTCSEMQLPLRGISPDALAFISEQPWPGNIRQLINFVRRLVVFSEKTDIDLNLVRLVASCENSGQGTVPKQLPPYKQAKEKAIAAFARQYVQTVLAQTGGNISQAARLSGLERVSLQKIIKRLNIDPAGFST